MFLGFAKEETERSHPELNGLDPEVRMGPGLPLYILIQYRGHDPKGKCW